MCAVGLWLASLIGTGAYMWRRPGISVANKLIHMRMVAQAALITGLWYVNFVMGTGVVLTLPLVESESPASFQMTNQQRIRPTQCRSV